MLEFFGWLGGILLGICALPQAIHSFRTKSAEGISTLFLLIWLFGEIFTLAYVVPKGHAPLIFNYVLNIVLISVILKYKVIK